MEFFDKEAVIETERLILRRLREEDALAIYHNINHDKEVLKYYLDRYIEKEEDASVSGTIRFCDETKRYVFAIVLKETDEVIGMINQCSGMNKFFHSIEIGYAIGQKYWHNGYVTEATKAFIDFLFKRGVHKVFCGAIPENTRSIRVMKNCGMIYEGRKIDEVYYRDRYWDIDQYYLLNPYVSRETSSKSAD
ncbi:MAG: GNAT family N-acetyltransferase [Erysipelotrichaceae bacterium]|nr:GNAT family N-acetyltransferase [Erysipelotrichaceae bacterium]